MPEDPIQPEPAGFRPDSEKLTIDLAKRGSDRAIEAVLEGPWARLDENQKIAVALLAVAAALGPLGQGIAAALGLLFKSAVIPNTEQIVAVIWLFVIAAPVAIAALMFGALAGRIPAPGLFIALGIGSYLGGMFLAGADIPAQLGDLYCFASFEPGGIEYRHACRAFDALGFLDKARPYLGSPSGASQVLGWAWVYTTDARGTAMVASAAIGGVSAGYLIRRASG
jgi:hypothetical protein